MSNESSVKNLANSIEFDDPRLYTLLQQLIEDNYKTYNNLFPPAAAKSFSLTGQSSTLPSVSNFTAISVNNNLKLLWTPTLNASFYEIRYKLGTNGPSVWDTASTVVKTSTLSIDVNPLTIPLVFGNHTFLIKSVDSSGKYTDVASVLIFLVPTITAPVVTGTVVTNFVLLSWSQPTSTWLIDHFNVYKNGQLQGQVKGNFEVIFEVSGGVYTYQIEPVDIVGNIGATSVGLVIAVSNPADFTLHSSITSSLNGTLTNCYKENIAGSNYLLACVNNTKGWSQHFIDGA